MAVLCSYNLPLTCFLSFSSFRAEIAVDWLCQISQIHPKSYILLITCFHEFTNFFTNIWKSKQIPYWSKKAVLSIWEHQNKYYRIFISFSSSNTQFYESPIFCLFTFWVFFPYKSYKSISKYTQKCQYNHLYLKKKTLCNT